MAATEGAPLDTRIGVPTLPRGVSDGGKAPVTVTCGAAARLAADIWGMSLDASVAPPLTDENPHSARVVFDNDPVDPSDDEVHDQLARILGSPVFKTSERLSRFLRHIVTRTRAGEGDRLKEFVIGTEVFDRGESYDPRVDSVVRVEAGRLRARLMEYYSTQGTGDSIIITVPRGGYTPVFERRKPAPDSVPPGPTARERRRFMAGIGLGVALLAVIGVLSLAPRRQAPSRAIGDVRVAVMPFVSDANEDGALSLAARLTEGVNHELVRLGMLQVVAHGSVLESVARGDPVMGIARSLRADVVVQARVARADQRVTVEAVVVDVAQERKFRVDDFTGSTADVSGLAGRIAAGVARAVDGHF